MDDIIQLSTDVIDLTTKIRKVIHTSWHELFVGDETEQFLYAKLSGQFKRIYEELAETFTTLQKSK